MRRQFSIFNLQFSICDSCVITRRRLPIQEKNCKLKIEKCKLKIERLRSTPVLARDRRGLSLFEVVISLTIFACSMAAIGHLVSTGVRGAVRSRLESQAIMRSESKMAEVAAGIIPLQNTNGTFPDDAAWNWSTAVSAGQYPDLYVVEVTATHPSTTTVGKMSYSLRRLVRDPQLEMLAYQKQLEATQASQSSSSTTTSSGSSTGTGK
jgi:Tfp pilus assembly protein PilV